MASKTKVNVEGVKWGNSKYASPCYAYAKQMNECVNFNLDSTNTQTLTQTNCNVMHVLNDALL